MHSYSLDNLIRSKVYVFIGIVSFVLPSLFNKMIDYSGLSHSIVWPLSTATTYAILFLVFDKFLWRISFINKLLAIPNLNGTYDASGLSSHETDLKEGVTSFEFSMTVNILQTFSKMEVHTQTKDSTSRSTLAGLEIEHTIPIFRYAYENVPMNRASNELQRHSGFIELRIEKPDVMYGDYFSGKHRLKYGELNMTKRGKNENSRALQKTII